MIDYIRKSNENNLIELKQRLADSIEIALSLSDGLLYLLDNDTDKIHIFSSNFSCPISGFTIDEIEPDYFHLIIQALVVNVMVLVTQKYLVKINNTHEELTFRSVIAPWSNNTSKLYIQTLNHWENIIILLRH